MKTNLVFQLTGAEAVLVRAALREAMRLGGTESQSHGLEYIALDSCAGPGGLRPARLPRAPGPRHTFPIRTHTDQIETICGALDRIRGCTGCEDDSQALVQMCLQFLDQPAFENFGGCETPGLAPSGQTQGKGESGHQPAHPSTPSLETSVSTTPGLSVTRRRVDRCPKPAQRTKRTRHRRGSTLCHLGGGGARTVTTRGSRQMSAGDTPRDPGSEMKLLGPFPSFPITTVRALALICGVPEQELREMAATAEALYEPGWVEKHGVWRHIDKPHETLKEIQRRLFQTLLDPLIDSPIAYGVRGRTQIDAARKHARQPCVATEDIEGFFDNVSRDLVAGLLGKIDCPADLASVLTGLLTYQGHLPQGAPTSPAIATLLLAASDRRLFEIAEALDVTLVRYVDDYLMSGDDPEAIRQVVAAIEKELDALGLRLNPEKSKIRARHEPQIVLGLTVNNGVSVPKPYRNELACAVFQASKDGCTQEEYNQLRGCIAYVGQLHRKEARRLQHTLAQAAVKNAA